jgi:hypothetical protein
VVSRVVIGALLLPVGSRAVHPVRGIRRCVELASGERGLRHLARYRRVDDVILVVADGVHGGARVIFASHVVVRSAVYGSLLRFGGLRRGLLYVRVYPAFSV